MYRGSAVVAHARVAAGRPHRRPRQRAAVAATTCSPCSAGLRGENIVWTDLDGWRDGCWRRRGCATRRSAARCRPRSKSSIAEREPIGIGRIDGELYLVDERGVVIDEYGPQYADLDLPIIDGLAAGRRCGRGDDDDARGELAARLIAALRAKPDDRRAACRRST